MLDQCGALQASGIIRKSPLFPHEPDGTHDAMNWLISRTLSDVHLKIETRRYEINVTKNDSFFQVVESWDPY